MADDVLINKAATIERCVARAREEYDENPATFQFDLTRQDAAILNIQRACEAALDMAQHLLRRERWLDSCGFGRRDAADGGISKYRNS